MIIAEAEKKFRVTSPIHKMDTRFKLIGMLALSFSIAFLTEIKILFIAFLVSISMLFLSKLPISFVLNKLKLPGILIGVLAVMTLFFSSGEIVFKFGSLTVTKEGINGLTLLMLRFMSMMCLMIILFSTTTITQIIKAFRDLKLPMLLCDMILFTYRYLFELYRDFTTMQTSLRLRGHRIKSLKAMKTLASMNGALLIRSYEQSERVYYAMTLRGYGEEVKHSKGLRPSSSDYAWFILFIITSLLLLFFQFVII